jgi:hypothetical protein
MAWRSLHELNFDALAADREAAQTSAPHPGRDRTRPHSATLATRRPRRLVQREIGYGTLAPGSEAVRTCLRGLLGNLEPVYLAVTQEEREAVYRFRYGIYVEELGRRLGRPDHTAGLVHDDEDEQPYTLLLYTCGPTGITGTLRLRHWMPGEVPPTEWETFSMSRLPGLGAMGTAEVGRLMVAPSGRGDLTTLSLVTTMYQLLVEQLGVDVLFANCAPALVHHYTPLGLRTYDGELVATPDGVEVPLVGLVSDRGHLKRTGSVMAPVVDAVYRITGRSPSPTGVLAEALDARPTSVWVDADAVWRRIRRRLGTGERSAPGLLGVLAPEALRTLARHGLVIVIPEGELVTAKGLAQRELFVLLDGACDVREGRRVITALRRGDVIGEVALFGTPGRQLASVYTHTRSEILVLPRRSFRALRATDPGAAADALYALSRVMADRVAANRY